jgi:hypothetical protein
MADQSNDTQSKINEEDRDIAARPENRTGHDRDKFNQGSSSMPGGANEAEGIFAHDGEGVTGEALGGGPLGTGNTGAELPGGAQSEFARMTGGQTDGLTTGNSGAAGSASGGAGGQSVGTVGTIGGSNDDTSLDQRTEVAGAGAASTGTDGSISQGGTNEYGAQGTGFGQGSTGRSGEPAGADHQHSALGGSVTAAGGNSDSPGPGQTGTDRSGFIGSEANEGAEQAQRRGSAEQPASASAANEDDSGAE